MEHVHRIILASVLLLHPASANVKLEIVLPYGNASKAIKVSENSAAGTLVARFVVSDPAGEPTQCCLTDLNYRNFSEFQLERGGREDYALRSSTPLDRERRSVWKFLINCNTDDGVEFGWGWKFRTLSVHISDQNDNSPSFEIGNYTLAVRENNDLLYRVGRVSAYDLDAGKNGTVTYALASESDYFRIDPDTGILYPKIRLDREQVAKHYLEVIASDGGTPPRQSKAVPVHISIQDENDNAPQFPDQKYYASVAADADIDTSILRVQAADPDEGRYGEIRYRLSEFSDYVQIGRHTGIISVRKPLTGLDKLDVLVIASDLGGRITPGNQGTPTSVEITVL